MNGGAALNRILVPIDGSTCSDAAVAYALRLAAPAGHVFFANAIDVAGSVETTVTPYGGDPAIVLDALQEERRTAFAAALARATAAGVAAQTIELSGPAVEAIVALIPHVRADAVVMGTHGRRGLARAALGSVADGVMRRSGVPTFVVHASDGRQPEVPFPIRRIVAAVDGSDASRSAATYAIELAAASGAHVVFVHVGDGAQDAVAERALERARELAAVYGLGNSVVHAKGNPADAIVATATGVDADAIAIGTRNVTGPARLLLGVAARVVLSSAIPVVAVCAAPVAEHPEAVR